jgi:hypothetical protein
MGTRAVVGPPGDLVMRLPGGATLERDFSVIPSETSLAERMYLYFLAREMTGDGNILELGPFLGGTTRALARGLEHSGIAGRRLVTVDQFDNYYDISTFKQFGISETGADDKMLPFREIFERFHRDESYFPFIDARTVKIADLPDETTDYAFLEGLDNLQAVFVDGCKSWYSVKDFISRVSEHTEPGSHYLFQDYGRFTCFWIPAFAESFPEHFRFVGSVDSTFAYRLIKPLTSAEIDGVFSDQPDGMDPKAMDRLYECVFAREKEDGRAGGMVTSRIQAAAFHAYVGDKEKARSLLTDLEQQDFVRGNLVNRLREALVSPTYTPNGKVRL